MKENEISSPSEELTTDISTSLISSIMSNNSIELCSPERIVLPGECVPFPPVPAPSPGPRDPELVLYVPDMEEIRISPVIARKGYLNVLEHKTNGWKKRWVVSAFYYNTCDFLPSHKKKIIITLSHMFVCQWLCVFLLASYTDDQILSFYFVWKLNSGTLVFQYAEYQHFKWSTSTISKWKNLGF